MLAQKQPPLKECVTAHWPRGPAPKIPGAQARNRSRGMDVSATENPSGRCEGYAFIGEAEEGAIVDYGD